MKKILMAAVALICMTSSYAQETRNARVIVGINNLSYTVKEKPSKTAEVLGTIADALLTGEVTTQLDGYQEAVRAAIVKGFSQARRITAIDGQLTENELAAKHVYYIDATVSNVSTTSKTEETADKKHYKTYYKGIIGVTLHIKDAHSDEVIGSPTFNVSATDMSWIETAEGAINNALVRLSSGITDYCNRWLPLRGTVLEGARDKKDKQKELYIDLGSQDGIGEDIHLAVYKVKTIAGREAKEQIGKLKVETVEGADISLCKVQKGGKEIKAALDAGETLIVETLE